VLFAGVDALNKVGLWATNGTSAGAYELTGILGANVNGLQPTNMQVIGGNLLFNGLDSNNHWGLWETDGTGAGTHELSVTGAYSSGINPTSLALATISTVISTANWVNSTGGDWDTAANWSLNGVPSSQTDASILVVGGNHTVTSALSRDVYSVQAGAGVILDITSGTFTLAEGTSTAGGGSGTNAGTVKVGAGATFDISGVFDNDTTGVLSAAAAGAIVDLKGATISAGKVSIAAGATLEATGGGSLASTIAGSTVTDVGTLLATGGTTLTLQNTTVNATGGMIEASDATAIMVLAGSRINKGTVQTGSDGVIETLAGTNSTLNGTTIVANTAVQVLDGSTLSLAGTIANHGEIDLESSGDATILAITSNVSLSGSGSIALSDVPGSTTNEILAIGASNVSPFKLATGTNTIGGAGAIGNGDGTLVFNVQAGGTLNANGTHSLTIDTGRTVLNGGLMEATGSGGLVVQNALLNSGTLAADGGNVTVYGNLTGSGLHQLAEIFSGDRMELKSAANTTAISFQDNNNTTDTGVLVLDHSSGVGALAAFKGTTANFANDGTNSDTLDLQDINFASGVTWTFKEAANGQQGVLAMKDGLGDTTNITLLGQCLAANGTAQSGTSSLFQLSADNFTSTTGTLVTTSFKP
jgi:hypothetical protein